MTLGEYFIQEMGGENFAIGTRNFPTALLKHLAKKPLRGMEILAIRERPLSGPLIIAKSNGCSALALRIDTNFSKPDVLCHMHPLVSFQQHFNLDNFELGIRPGDQYLGRVGFEVTLRAGYTMADLRNGGGRPYDRWGLIESKTCDAFERNNSLVLVEPGTNKDVRSKILNWDAKRIMPMDKHKERLKELYESTAVAGKI